MVFCRFVRFSIDVVPKGIGGLSNVKSELG